MANRVALASKNIAFGLMSKAIMMVLEFVSRAFFVQILGAELLGVNSVFISIIQMMSVAELGLTNVMIYSYYEPLAKNDHRKLAALVGFYKKMYRLVAALVLLIGICLIPVLPFMINGEGNVDGLYGPYMLLVADAAISYLLVYRVAILRADQRGYIVTTYEIIINMMRVVAQIVCLCVTGSYFLYILVKAFGTASINVVSTIRARKDYPFALKKESLAPMEARKVARTIGSGFLYRISAVLLNSTTNIIISITVSTVVVGYVENYTTIIVAVTSIMVVLFTNLTPSVGNLAVMELAPKRLEIFNIMLFAGSWLTIVFVGCTALLSNDFIALWLGGEFVLEESTVACKMLLMFVSCVMQPVFAYREAVGLYRQTKYVMLVAAILNLGLSLSMGYIWGLDGILLASALSCLLTYFWYEPRVLFRMYFSGGSRAYFKRVLVTFALTTFVVFLGHFCAMSFQVNSWGAFVLKGCALFIALNGICFVFYRKSKEFAFVAARMVSMLSRLRARRLDDESEA